MIIQRHIQWAEVLATVLSLTRTVFNPTPFSVGFAVDTVALGESFLFPCQYYPIHPIHSSATDAI